MAKLYYRDLNQWSWLPGVVGQLFAANAANPPAPFRPGAQLSEAPVDHVGVAFASKREYNWHWEHYRRLFPVIEPDHVWPPENEGGCPSETPLAHKKYMASLRCADARLVFLTSYSAGDVIDRFIVRNGGTGIHHLAAAVGSIDRTIGDLIHDFPSIRLLTAKAVSDGQMNQVFLKLDPDVRIIELVERYGSFDGTFVCESVGTLTRGEDQRAFVGSRCRFLLRAAP